jgi:hypothetical protein
MRSFLHGAVQLHVLHHAAEHPIHGAWMAAELARHDDLEAGRRIRRYTITDAGRAALAEARRALRELADELLT